MNTPWNDHDTLALAQQIMERSKRTPAVRAPSATLGKTRHNKLYRDLCGAVNKGDWDKARSLLDDEVPVFAWDSPDDHSVMNLVLQARPGVPLDIVRILVERGLKISFPSSFSLAQYAENRDEVVAFLLDLFQHQPDAMIVEKKNAGDMEAYRQGDASRVANIFANICLYNASCCTNNDITNEAGAALSRKAFAFVKHVDAVVPVADALAKSILENALQQEQVMDEVWDFALQHSSHLTKKDWNDIFSNTMRGWHDKAYNSWGSSSSLLGLDLIKRFFQVTKLCSEAELAWSATQQQIQQQKDLFEQSWSFGPQGNLLLQALDNEKEYRRCLMNFNAKLISKHWSPAMAASFPNFLSHLHSWLHDKKNFRPSSEQNRNIVDLYRWRVTNFVNILVAAASPFVLGLVQTPEGVAAVRKAFEDPATVLQFGRRASRFMLNTLDEHLQLGHWTDVGGNSLSHYKIFDLGPSPAKTPSLALTWYPAHQWITPNNDGLTPKEMALANNMPAEAIAQIERAGLRKEMGGSEVASKKMRSRTKERRRM